MQENKSYVFAEGSSNEVLIGFDGTCPCGEYAIDLKRSSSARIYVLHSGAQECTSAYRITIEEGAALEMVLVTAAQADFKGTVTVDLQGPHAECRLGGLYLADESRCKNFSVEMNHNVPDCYSSQLFKGLVGGSAVTDFYGKIYVAPDAQKTEAYQACHNILLSKDAKATAKPQLEIYADDVKCSHGATVGRLNEDELFYMRSRGISEKEAVRLQQRAFAAEVLEIVSNDSVREKLSALL